ncbi:IS5 family transposase [Streptomyces sp. NPDC101151]|uniref:IS5 family transposase n=1 Tax=Streptomyces sp. NPDC101151 TaxID=3366115 RepID=UPI00380BD77B
MFGQEAGGCVDGAGAQAACVILHEPGEVVADAQSEVVGAFLRESCEEWAVLEPLLPVSNNRCGRWRDHRQVINGIIHRLSTGCQWRQLPERFGPWQAVHKRHTLWSADGTWERLLQHVQAAADAAGDIEWHINVDSTPIRAHQHAAGAPKAPSPVPPTTSKGRREGSVPMRLRPLLEEAVRKVRRSAGPAAGSPRSFHLAADGECRPLALLVTPGQRADCTQMVPLMDKVRGPRMGPGRPRRLPTSVSADKAYSNSKIRAYLRRRAIPHVIPEKSNHKAARRKRGARGGRPAGFDRARYKARNTVERAINKLKQVRAVAGPATTSAGTSISARSPRPRC